MGIRFTCIHCGKQLNIKDRWKGERVACPACLEPIVIPEKSAIPDESAKGQPAAANAPNAQVEQSSRATEGLSDSVHAQPLIQAKPAAADLPVNSPPESASETQSSLSTGHAAGESGPAVRESWFVLPTGSATQHGPVDFDVITQWLREGRITPIAHVRRQSSQDWLPLLLFIPAPPGTAFGAPSGASFGTTPGAAVASPQGTASAAYPALGVIPFGNAPTMSSPLTANLPGSGPPLAISSMAPTSASIQSAIQSDALLRINPRKGRPRREISTGVQVTLVVMALGIVVLGVLLYFVISGKLWSTSPKERTMRDEARALHRRI